MPFFLFDFVKLLPFDSYKSSFIDFSLDILFFLYLLKFDFIFFSLFSSLIDWKFSSILSSLSKFCVSIFLVNSSWDFCFIIFFCTLEEFKLEYEILLLFFIGFEYFIDVFCEFSFLSSFLSFFLTESF